jgi:hypothetical protein
MLWGCVAVSGTGGLKCVQDQGVLECNFQTSVQKLSLKVLDLPIGQQPRTHIQSTLDWCK